MLAEQLCVRERHRRVRAVAKRDAGCVRGVGDNRICQRGHEVVSRAGHIGRSRPLAIAVEIRGKRGCARAVLHAEELRRKVCRIHKILRTEHHLYRVRIYRAGRALQVDEHLAAKRLRVALHAAARCPVRSAHILRGLKVLVLAAVLAASHRRGGHERAARVIPIELVLRVRLGAGKEIVRIVADEGGELDLVHRVQRASVPRVLGELAVRLHNGVARARGGISVGVVHLLHGAAIRDRALRFGRHRKTVVAQEAVIRRATGGHVDRKAGVHVHACACVGGV